MAGLLLQDKNPATATATSTAAAARARCVAAAECDVTDIVDIRRCVDAAVGEFGRLDILVNNAMADPGLSLIPFMETTDAHMDNYWQSGPLATFHFMQVCYPHMRGHDSAIVNVGSRAGSTRPIDRAGDCELDIGGTVVYLASELSAFVTGHTVMVDGGSCRF